MNLSTKTKVCAVIVAFCLVGCVYDVVLVPFNSGLPEEIYTTPQLPNRHRITNVAIFGFIEPYYAEGLGRAAAQYLYEELIKREVANVTPELDVSGMRIEDLMDIARTKGYDVIIAGDLLYYFEGGLHQPSRVDERIRVIHVATNETLWYAKAIEMEPPTGSSDYIFVQTRSDPAPAARALMKKNAEKFCKLLLSSPQQEFSAPAVPRTEEPAKVKRIAAVEESRIAAVKESQVAAVVESRAAQKALEEQRLLEESLQEEAKASRERAERERFLNEHIYFELDRSRLLPEAEEILRRKAGWLMAHPNASVTIEGHCDERGTYEGNMVLGDRRARSTKSYLVGLGVAPERLKAVSCGWERPVDPSHNEKAWAVNRRAQFMIE
jgi:peptidoglycan-associated lipoprotein